MSKPEVLKVGGVPLGGGQCHCRGGVDGVKLIFGNNIAEKATIIAVFALAHIWKQTVYFFYFIFYFWVEPANIF